MGIEPCMDWFQVQKTKPQVGANKTFHWMFVKYLISKTQSEFQWAWLISKTIRSTPASAEAQGLFEQHKQETFAAKTEEWKEELQIHLLNPFTVMRRPHPHNRIVLRKMDSKELSCYNSNNTPVAVIIVISSIILLSPLLS